MRLTGVVPAHVTPTCEALCTFVVEHFVHNVPMVCWVLEGGEGSGFIKDDGHGWNFFVADDANYGYFSLLEPDVKPLKYKSLKTN